MKPIVRVLPVAIAFSIAFGGAESALAQDSVAAPNPLQGLFTPQPQYPTPQSPPNPQPFVPGGSEANPIKNLFNVQPQYPNSQTQPFATPEGPPGTTNHLQGFFTGQNPFQTPQTPINPQATPHALSPEFVKQAGDKGVTLTDKEKDLIKHLSPEAQAAVAAAEEKEKAAASPTGSGEKLDQDKTAMAGDRDHMGGGSTLVMFICFGVAYMGLVHIMSSFTFDTVFIALYMTALSVFVLRAFIAGFSHRA